MSSLAVGFIGVGTGTPVSKLSAEGMPNAVNNFADRNTHYSVSFESYDMPFWG